MKYTYEFLKSCDGLRFRAKQRGRPIDGMIRVFDSSVWLYYGAVNWLAYPNSEGFGGYYLITEGDNEEYFREDFTDFEIVPRDPETYKDWQVGDKIAKSFHGRQREVIFRSGEVVIYKLLPNEEAIGPYTCGELFEKGFRLVLTDIEKQIINKRREAVWKPQDGDICYVKSIFAEWLFIKKGDINETDTCACMELGKDSVDLTPGYVTEDNMIKKLRPATDEEKQRLFAALAKEGKRWNAEKNVVEDIPEPYKFRKGEPVLVRDDNRPWAIRAYVETENGFYATTSTGTDRAFYRHCIPYNEKTMHLLGKSDNYEEEDK